MKYALILTMFFFFGCISEARKMAKVDGVLNKYPKQSAEQFRKKFPCIVLGKDTIYTMRDTTMLIELPCPDTNEITKDVVYKKVLVERKIKVPGIDVYHFIEDSAKITALEYLVKEYEQREAAYKKRFIELESEATTKNNARSKLIWGVLLTLLMALIIFLKNKTQKKPTNE